MHSAAPHTDMDHGESPLLKPVQVGGLSLRNRVVMAPMTREQSSVGIPGPRVAEYYRQRAAGGVGLIITEGSAHDPAGAFGAAVPRFYGTDALNAWRTVVVAVHAAGAAIVPQLWHVGAFEPSVIGMADTANGIDRLSPSGLAAPDRPMGRPMTERDIETAIERFGAAAANARSLGFDGIELHGAHGYLLDQFFWAGTNLRTDAYGMTRRTRFAEQVVRECRRRAGPDFPIIVRFSQWKQLDYAATLADTPQQLEALLVPLVDAGVDIFHCSTRRFADPAFAADGPTLAGWTRKLTGRPTIVVGSVTLGTDFKAADGKTFAAIDTRDIARLETMLANGEFDLLALGRALIANPGWVQLVSEGRLADLRPFEKWMLDQL